MHQLLSEFVGKDMKVKEKAFISVYFTSCFIYCPFIKDINYGRKNYYYL